MLAIDRPLFKYIKNFCIIILFAWISFFSQPVQDDYWVYVRILLGIFLIFLVSDIRYRKGLISISDWPVWVFLVSLSAGLVNAIDKDLALRTFLYLVTTFFLLYYIGKAIYRYGEDRELLGKIICLCGFLVALFALLELYFGRNILYERYISNPFYIRYAFLLPRPMSTLLNPTIVGTFLLGCLPFSLGFLRKKSLRAKIIGGCLTILFIIVTVRTYSRGVFLALIVLLVFYLLIFYKRKFIFFFAVSIILFFAACSYQHGYGLSRFGMKGMIFGSFDSIISKYRLDRLQVSLKMIEDRPSVGVGLNHFRVRFDEYIKTKTTPTSYEFKIPDNMYLSLLAETGLAGTISFFIFIILLFKRGILYLRKEEDYDKRQALLMPVFALIAFLVNMVGYDLFYWATPYMLFSLFCGFTQSAIE